MHVESAQVKDKMLQDFQECIDAGAAACASFMRTYVGPPPGAFVLPPRGFSNLPCPPGPPGPSGSPGPPMNHVPMRGPPGPPFGFPPGQGPPPYFNAFPPQTQGPSCGPSPAPLIMGGPSGPPGPPHVRKSPSVRSVGSSLSNGYPPTAEGTPLAPLPHLPPPGNFGPPPMFPPPNGFGSPVYSNGNRPSFNSRTSSLRV